MRKRLRCSTTEFSWLRMGMLRNQAKFKQLATATLLASGGIIFTASAAVPGRVNTSVAILKTAQRFAISGKVVDDKGLPLIGVSILEKGTTNGIQTDVNGNFKLSVQSENSVLVITYIGYVKQEVAVAGKSILTITLQADVKTLNDVVVIGYGQQSRKIVSTAISKIDNTNINNRPVGNVAQALASQAPGLEVQTDRGGTPGATPSVRVRGAGSLGTSTAPLYVVDGYPLQNSDQFDLINPVDIESIDILKDAASAAIYGSRAGNGVVIVTTKRGKSGKTAFSVNGFSGVQHLAKKIDVLNSLEFIDHNTFVAQQRGTVGNLPTVFSTNPSSLPNTDWQDVVFRNAATNNIQINATGGIEKTRYNVSSGYFNQKGILIGTDYKRMSLRFNLDADLTPKLKLGVSIAPSYAETNKQPAAGQFSGTNASENGGTRGLGNTVGVATLIAPTIAPKLPNGDYGQPINSDKTPSGNIFYQSNQFNPLAIIEQNQNRFRNYRVFANTFLEWSVLKGLRLKTAGGFTMSTDQQSAYIPATLATDIAPSANISTPVLTNIFARESNTVSTDYLWENTATYDLTIGDHTLNVVGLASIQRYNSSYTAAAGRPGTFTTGLVTNPLGSPDLTGGLGYDKNAFVSYGGRVTYDYKKKYITSLALRSDASSRFGFNNRWAAFPSVSLAWRVSEEPFFQPLKNTINELKVRGSWGKTGNANIGSFNYLNNVVSNNYSFGGVRTFGYVQNGLANPDLTWEKNKQTDIGLEMGFLNDKFGLSLDYYDRTTESQLLNKDLPYTIGYATSYRANIGSLSNKGLELAVNANFDLGKLKWKISGNISGNRSKVLDLGGPQALAALQAQNGVNNVYQVRVGQPLGNMYGFDVLGIFKTQADLDRYPKVAGDKIGNWIIKDYNGDGVVDENDRHQIGKGVPDFIYGLTQNFSYGNFDLGLILQGVQGIDAIPGTTRQWYNNSGTSNVWRDFYHNMFDPANPMADVKYPSVTATGYNPNNQLTDRTVYNASFLRVQNVTLGYSLSPSALKALKIQRIRLYVSGENLLTFTSYPGYSPDLNINTGSVLQPGVDQGTYPNTRTILFGANISF